MVIENFLVQAKELSNEITSFLDEETINQIAYETGFVKRERKLSGFKFLDMLLFTHFNHKELSLNDLSIQLMDRFGLDLSCQSIDERFTNDAVLFFKKVLERILKKAVPQNTGINFTKYGKVRIKDSTCFQLPEAMKDKYLGSGGASSKASIRLQFEYDIKNGAILDLDITPFNVQDITNATNTIENIGRNDLVIRDLGYIKIGNLKKIQEQSAFYLNRLHNGVNAYKLVDGNYIEVDFAKLYKKMKRKGLTCIEEELYVGSKEKHKTRVVVELIPAEKYEERVRKTQRKASKNSRNVGKNAKARMGLNIFITNTDVPASQVRILYSLRWQIELMFKIWKSIVKIHEVKKMKIQRFEAVLFAKLIWISINMKIVWQIIIYFFKEHNIEISPYKLFKTLKNKILKFRKSTYKGSTSFFKFITKLIKMCPKKHKSQKRKNQESSWSYDIIRQFLLK